MGPKALREDMMALLSELVRHESPSQNKGPLDLLGTLLAGCLRQLGASVETIANDEGGDHVLGRFPGTTNLRPALVLGHFDTVWPLGTLERMPFRVDEDGRAFGPGIFDMKASLVICLEVMKQFQASGTSLPRPVWVLFTSDEEIGSPRSRGLIENLASQAAYVLVLEPALADGGLKTSRKGVGRFRLDVEGKAAHSGVAPENGRSAIVELTHQILRLEHVQDLAKGTTINVGLVQGGTATNVVPARAWADIDVRVSTAAEQARIEATLPNVTAVTRDVRLSLSGGFNRPPMERTPAVASLFEQARRIGRTIGFDLNEGTTGGGSDGNFTAAMGVPTLDGLGARGGGAHADDEHIVVDSLVERTLILSALLQGLQVEE